MSTCSCLTKDGLGPRCTRSVKDGEKLCTQHKKKCVKQMGQVDIVPKQESERLIRQQKQKQESERLIRQQKQKQESERLIRQQKEKQVREKLVPQRKVQVKPASKTGRGCVKQTQKKYTERPSPAFPANECCGQIMEGNDGKMYISVADVRGICRWKVHK